MNSIYDSCWLFVSLFLVIFCCCHTSLKSIKLVNLSSKLTPFKTVWQQQLDTVEEMIQAQENSRLLGTTCDTVGTLYVVQHNPVYTFGTGTEVNSGPFLPEDGKSLSYETFYIERAGQATYHGPGQIVLYPILDLNYFDKDINIYLRNLEQIIIDTVAEFGIIAGREPGLTGVWVGDVKIAAIGIKIRRWITMHGVSLNINPDLRYFSNIVPCGITDKSVGTVCQFNPNATMETVVTTLLDRFCNVFNCRIETNIV